MGSHRTASETPDQDHLKEDCRWNPCTNPAHNSTPAATITASCHHAHASRSLCDHILEMDQTSPQRLHLHPAESFDSSSANARPVVERRELENGSAPVFTTNGHHILSRLDEGDLEMRQPLLPALQPNLTELSGTSSVNTRSVVGRLHLAPASAHITATSGNLASRPLRNGTLERRQPDPQPLQSDLVGVAGSSSMNADLVVGRLEPFHTSTIVGTTNINHAPRPLNNGALEMRQSVAQFLQSNLVENPGSSSDQIALLEQLNTFLMGATAVLRNAVDLETPLAEARELATGVEGTVLLADQHIHRLRRELGAVTSQPSIVASPRLRLTSSRVSRGQTGSRRTGSSRNRPPSEESSRANTYLTLPARYRSGLTQTPTASASGTEAVDERIFSTMRQHHALNSDESYGAALRSSVGTPHSLNVPAPDPLAATLGDLATDVPPPFRVMDAVRDPNARIRSLVPENGSTSGEEEEDVDDQ